jgi:cell division transport system ATP-binding protein
VFQDFRLLEEKTLYENVAFAMQVVGASPKEIRRQVPMVLGLVGLSDRASQYPHQLSGGEKQRVSIARAIVNRPIILIADEPTGSLDPETAWEVMKVLRQISRRGTTILMATHAKDIVDEMQQRVVALEKGRIVRDVQRGIYGYET